MKWVSLRHIAVLFVQPCWWVQKRGEDSTNILKSNLQSLHIKYQQKYQQNLLEMIVIVVQDQEITQVFKVCLIYFIVLKCNMSQSVHFFCNIKMLPVVLFCFLSQQILFRLSGLMLSRLYLHTSFPAAMVSRLHSSFFSYPPTPTPTPLERCSNCKQQP